MKITSLEARSYRVPLDPPFGASWDPVPRATFNETIVVVHTDEGVDGFCGGASVPDVDLIEKFLIGVDVSETERVGGSAKPSIFMVAAIGPSKWRCGTCWHVGETSLCGSFSAEPATRIVCTSRRRKGSRRTNGPIALLASQAEGLTAAKIRFGSDWRTDLAVVEKARAAVGDDFALMVDANQGWRMPGDTIAPWGLATAAECAQALADLGCYWLEEPLATDDLDGYRGLAEMGLLPIAAGEMVRGLGETRRLLETVDVIQNDVVLAGGVDGSRRVAEWAGELGRVWSPHTWSTGFGLLANLHVALAWSTGPYLEFPYDPPGWTYDRRDFMLPEPLTISKGMLIAPDGPGLGYEPDLAYLEQWRIA